MSNQRQILNSLHEIPNSDGFVSTGSNADSLHIVQLLLFVYFDALYVIVVHFECVKTINLGIGLLKISQLIDWEHKNLFIVTRGEKIFFIRIATSHPLLMIIINCSSAIISRSVPKFDCLISTARDCYLSIWYIIDKRNRMLMSNEGFEAEKLLKVIFVSFIGRSPQLDCHVGRTRNQTINVPRDWIHWVGVSFQYYQLFFQFIVINSYGGVSTTRGENWFVWVQRNGINDIFVSFVAVI